MITEREFWIWSKYTSSRGRVSPHSHSSQFHFFFFKKQKFSFFHHFLDTEDGLISQYQKLSSSNNELLQNISNLEEFESRQEQLLEENNKLKELLEDEKRALKQYQANIDKLKKQSLDKLNKDIEEIERIKNKITKLEKDTKDGKRKFARMKRVNYLQVDKTRVQTQNLIKKAKRFHIEQMVSKDCLAEYQNMNYRQSKRIKTLKTEVQYIKYKLSEELYKFASQLELLKKERSEMEKMYSNKIESLSEHIHLKTNEVNNLRFLSKAIIYQKTELDKFFLETLELIKREQNDDTSAVASRAERASSSHGGSSKRLGSGGAPMYGLSGSKLPYAKYGKLYWGDKNYMLNSKKYKFKDFEPTPGKLESQAAESQITKLGENKVDFADLEWQEKEKIVRILYTKINVGVTPNYWKQIERLAQERELEMEVEGEEGLREDEAGEEELQNESEFQDEVPLEAGDLAQ